MPMFLSALYSSSSATLNGETVDTSATISVAPTETSTYTLVAYNADTLWELEAYGTVSAHRAPSVTVDTKIGNVASLNEEIELIANATDTDDSITGVSIYADGELLTNLTTAPFSTMWTPSSSGYHQISAKATDDSGITVESSPLISDKNEIKIEGYWNYMNFVFLTLEGKPTVVSNEKELELPIKISLNQNYPNPFNPSTTISYTVSRNNHVQLQVYDIMGRLVCNLVDEVKNSGEYTIHFDAGNLASGMYVYRLKIGSEILTGQMSLIR